MTKKTITTDRERGHVILRDRPSRILLTALALAAIGLAAIQHESFAQVQSCESIDERLTDLNCFDLVPVPAYRNANGAVLLYPASSPFGSAVTRDGTQRHRLTLILSDLPDTGDSTNTDDSTRSRYTAWVTTNTFAPIMDFGYVEEGVNDLGELAANKFILFVGIADTSGTGGRTPRVVLRGGSPSTRLQGHDPAFSSPLSALNPSSSSAEHVHEMAPNGTEDARWTHPPMHPAITMAPGMQTIKPSVSPFRVAADAPISSIALAIPRQTVVLADGDTLDLTAGLVRRRINGRDMAMLGYNGQYPGPLIKASEKSTIIVRFHNNVDAPTAVHWHGIRLENAFDGVPGITQSPVLFGESFEYRVTLPDPGLYWYHPHHREDIYQELGLYGNLMVEPLDTGYYNPVDSEEVLMLDDMLLDENGPIPFGNESANYMMMGRFGNVFLVNGSTSYSLDVSTGTVVRFYLTNVSNTRTFNLGLNGAKLKVIASDVSRFEREEWVSSVVMAPAERYIVEARFDSAGVRALTNNVHALNHTTGAYFPESDTLGLIRVRDVSNVPLDSESITTSGFDNLRTHEDIVRDIDRYRPHFGRSPDKHLSLTMTATGLPPVVEQLMKLETAYFSPVEWSGTMPMMNWVSTGNEVEWILRDDETGAENMDIDWRFAVGDVVIIRVTNDREAFHAMQHPLHIHGQRFLVVTQNGKAPDNLVWKDTVLLPSGSTTDLLLDLSNPGTWMVHCHIAEHLESGMKMTFDVH